MLKELRVEIVKWGELPEFSEQARDVILVGRLDGEDVCVRFFCPCENKTPIYIPFGKMNAEGGTGERKLIWVEKDKVLSIEPSIEVKAGCNCHFFIKNNKIA